MTTKMIVHKITNEENEAFKAFIQAAEYALEEPRLSFRSAAEQWKYFDDEDFDKGEILAIRKRIAKEESIDEDRIDDRILMYEWLKKKARKIRSFSLYPLTIDVLMDNVCDPTEDHLAFYPGFELNHVANEQ
jgi:hypothetical protein